MDQELTSMKMDKKEMKETDPIPMETSGSKGPQFPWGLQVTLEDASLKKMDIKLSDYKVGDMVELYAQCKITRLSETAHEGDKNPNRTMELQITDMCLESADEEARRKEWGDEEDSLGWEDDASSEKVTKNLKKKGY